MKVYRRMENSKQQRVQVVISNAKYEYNLGNLEKETLVDWLCVEERMNFNTFGTTWCFKKEEQFGKSTIKLTGIGEEGEAESRLALFDYGRGQGEVAKNIFDS